MNDFSHTVTAEATKNILTATLLQFHISCCPSLLLSATCLSFVLAAMTFCSGKNQRKTLRHQDKTLVNG